MAPSELVARETDVVRSVRMIGVILADADFGTVDWKRELPNLLILPGADDVCVSWEECRILVALVDLDDRGISTLRSTALPIARSRGCCASMER